MIPFHIWDVIPFPLTNSLHHFSRWLLLAPATRLLLTRLTIINHIITIIINHEINSILTTNQPSIAPATRYPSHPIGPLASHEIPKQWIATSRKKPSTHDWCVSLPLLPWTQWVNQIYATFWSDSERRTINPCWSALNPVFNQPSSWPSSVAVKWKSPRHERVHDHRVPVSHRQTPALVSAAGASHLANQSIQSEARHGAAGEHGSKRGWVRSSMRDYSNIDDYNNDIYI